MRNDIQGTNTERFNCGGVDSNIVSKMNQVTASHQSRLPAEILLHSIDEPQVGALVRRAGLEVSCLEYETVVVAQRRDLLVGCISPHGITIGLVQLVSMLAIPRYFNAVLKHSSEEFLLLALALLRISDSRSPPENDDVIVCIEAKFECRNDATKASLERTQHMLCPLIDGCGLSRGTTVSCWLVANNVFRHETWCITTDNVVSFPCVFLGRPLHLQEQSALVVSV
mmetsp:Transcript_12664/g.36845  ORF Transcript_12664/g.36845 Transcript_12664/m.36845 type:complete len:226 (+) Transcript_12664:3198-3875(+)